MHFRRRCVIILESSGRRTFPGVAKFGIALEWGSRGLEFESRHSDQIMGSSFWNFPLFISMERFEPFECRYPVKICPMRAGPHRLYNVPNLDTRTKKSRTAFAVLDFLLFLWRDSKERIRLSGGQSIAAGLDGGNTIEYRISTLRADSIRF